VQYDSFDICEAYYVYMYLWNAGGLTVRDHGRKSSISCQLHRLRFRPHMSLSLETLTENGRAIYDALVEKWE
jgi:hypothetical protein